MEPRHRIQDINAQLVRAALRNQAAVLDEVFAIAAERYFSHWGLKEEDLAQATEQIARLSGDGHCDYTRFGVPFEYVLRYQGRQVNTALSAMFDAVLEHNGPVRIVDLGAGTAAVEVAVALLLHALEAHGIAGDRHVEILAVEPSRVMFSMGRLLLEELEQRIDPQRLKVSWWPKAKTIQPYNPLSAPTWIVGAHVLHPPFSPDTWAKPLHLLAERLQAHRIYLTSSRRRADYDLIWGVQAAMRVSWGIARGAWELAPGRIDDVPYALIGGGSEGWVLPKTAAVARAAYGEEGPVPAWHRYPPSVYRLLRRGRARPVAAAA
ncbi:MAG TPA: hypothetical protein VM307_06370 [Egibacteraceae bacterium]|nr:hypothetical protein [Egibacteraceae bacterium]